MSYIRVSDFRAGVDTTRPDYAAEPGTLVECVNGHVTRGGDIERRLPFDPAYELPAGTFGLFALGTILYVFGSGADPGVGAGVTYQRLQHPDGASMVGIIDAEGFGGDPYVVAEYDDGAVYHFFNGVRVTDWDSIAEGDSSLNAVAEYLAQKINLNPAFQASGFLQKITIIASVPGTPFTVTASATNGGGTDDQTVTVTQIQANVVAVDETPATGSFEITGGTLGEPGDNAITAVTVDGVDIMNADPIDWITSHEFTAELVANAINAESATSGYSASVAGAVVTVRAPAGTGATENGNALAVATSGNVVISAVANMSGGVAEIEAVSQIEEIELGGSYEAADSWLVTVDGTPHRSRGFTPGMGAALKTFKSKLYTAADRKLRFSALDDPTDWSTLVDGAGFVAFANQDGTSERLVGIQQYLDDLAVFGRRTVQIERVDPDPNLNALVGTLSNTGAVAARSIIDYANTDVFYLSDAGIRSLRPRATTDTAFSDDVGVNIDTTVIAALSAASAEDIENAVSVLEPTNSRLLVALGTTIFVFSYFPGKSIAAWTTYELDFRIEQFAIIDRLLYARAGDTIYAYGGTTGLRTPDDGELTLSMRFPYVTGDRDPSHKMLTGFDIAMTGVWTAEIKIDPNDRDIGTQQIKIDKITHPYGRIAMEGHSSHFAPILSCDSGGVAAISNVVMHYETGEET